YDESLKRVETEMAIMNRRCAEVGRKMRYCLSVCVLMADTDEEATKIAEGYMAQLEHDPSIKSASAAVGAGVVGSPRTVVERLRRYESMGIDMFLMQFYPMRQGLDEFAARVLPDLTFENMRTKVA